MKRTSLVLAAIALTAMVGGTLGASASHCGSTGSAHDPYGSCEEGGSNFGNTKCGSGHTDVAGVGKVAVDPTKGAQICNDGGPVPVQGRITAYKDSNNNLVVSSDGDRDNSGGAKSWTRVDVKPGAGSCKVRLRRSSDGNHWQDASGNPTTPDGGGLPNGDNCAA